MRVVVSVKPTPGGGQTSQAARYIAYRERDEEREGTKPRPLFSAKENVLSFWKAERVLTEGRTPQKDELIHIAVSFRDGDFQALGGNETARGQSLREVTREAVSHIADELRTDELRWVAGIHRNTDHPHIHLLIHRAYLDRETRAERRLARIPAQMLAARFRDENGVEKINPGSFSQAFETALDRAQERARAELHLKEKAATSDERLLEAARANPSLAGRELIEEIILRGPVRESDERPETTDLRAAFRTPSLDDPEYRTQPEQADWLGARSQELRDLYERGAEVKGDVLIIPAEEHELPAGGDQPFITGLAYAHQQIRNAEQAAEFHALARTIAGQTADPRTEIEIFRHYAQIRAEKLERTLDEMRLLAAEMARLETRESIEIARPVISFEDAQEAERGEWRDPAENDIEHDADRAEVARNDEDTSLAEDRDQGATIGSFNTAARKVRLDDESLRLPAGLSSEMKLQIVTRTLPALDRQMENGRARSEILTAIGEAVYRGDVDERELEERFRIGGFLKAYVAERLSDPETRVLNTSAAFRLAHQQITEARTPEDLNGAAEQFLRENLDRGNALRLHQADPARYPKPETMPLNPQERNLLFFGRAAEHHTAEMRELRHAWGLSRAERAARVEALHEGRLSPSPVLEQMLTELDTRRSVPALRHYQASILNEEMRNPGRLNLRQMYDRLPPHERTFLIERIEEKKERITRSQTPTRDSKEDISPASGGRPFGSIPRKSHSYREYLASMGAAELRLLNEAVRQRHNGNGHILTGKEDYLLSITGARALLPREEQARIREQARHLAWEQITPPEVFAAQPEAASRDTSDTIAHLQEETQPRARLAHTALNEFLREKAGVNDRNEPHSADALSRLAPADSQRLRALEDYAARMREELYRGFESLDALRREMERPHGLDAAERTPSIEPNSHFASDRDPIFSLNGHSAAKDLQLFNGGHFDPDRNSTVDGPPDDRDREPWLVDSTRKWHFDSLRDLAEPIPIADHSIEHDHDFSLDR